MSLLDILTLGSGGFFGAITRYFISRKMNEPRGFPKGTLVVNWLGCLLIGMVFGLDLPWMWTLFLASGFVGSLTTFSTMNKELIVSWKSEKKQSAVVYLLLSYAVGFIITMTGYFTGTLI